MCQAMNSVFAHFIFCQYLGTILKVVRTKKPEVNRHELYEEHGHYYDNDEDHLKHVLVDAGVDGLLRIQVPDSRVELQARVSAALILASKCMR